MAIEIVAFEEPHRRYWLRVDLNEHGDLVLEGQDLSPGIESFSGRDEYEYWYTVKAADLPKLLETLGAASANSANSANNLAVFADLLRERFAKEHGLMTSTAFKTWCKDHDIPYAFSSY